MSTQTNEIPSDVRVLGLVIINKSREYPEKYLKYISPLQC